MQAITAKSDDRAAERHTKCKPLYEMSHFGVKMTGRYPLGINIFSVLDMIISK